MSITIDDGPQDLPDQITASNAEGSPKRSVGEHVQHIGRAFTTKQGLIGTYDYAFLFKPNLPFIKKSKRRAPFFGLQDSMPVVLSLLLGFQHALAMLAGVITPPIIIASAASFDANITQYLVSTSLIVCGILSAVQITRFHVYKTPYYIGTGLISVVGTSFAIIPVASKGLGQMYKNGMCPSTADGTPLPCPEGYGAILGTASLCALLEIGLSFMTPSLLKKLFPPIVTGPTVTLIGVSLIQTALQGWAGGSGSCLGRPTSGDYMLCPSNTGAHALPWGSAEFIGLGFSVFVTIIICERFGSPIMKSLSVVLGLLIGCIIAAATGYFDRSSIDAAPVASFIWVHTFPLSVYGPLILPMLAIYLILMMEAIGDITATCDVSRLQVDGKLFDSRIQGGVLADGLNGMLAGLCTITPMSTFAQNNGVIALTRCANRKAGYAACFFLIVMGVFSKFAAALTAIPASVLGGMTTFLFASVAVSGIRIIATVPFTRRTRFILTAAMSLGFGAILVPDWFTYVFTYTGGNKAKAGFFDAIVLVLETGFAVTAFIAVILNLILSEEDEAEETESLAGDLVERDEVEDRYAGKVVEMQSGPSTRPSGGSTAAEELKI
ncbi:Purine permease [Lachnellula occidentalis]|uniref:Purine permease n=1 Tax=Lachnellula occidentalis TaxID=215460 RepID=A0A8H8UI27_9HELO|nr:Purine permease [Lachnellula occidentalis]